MEQYLKQFSKKKLKRRKPQTLSRRVGKIKHKSSVLCNTILHIKNKQKKEVGTFFLMTDAKVLHQIIHISSLNCAASLLNKSSKHEAPNAANVSLSCKIQLTNSCTMSSKRYDDSSLKNAENNSTTLCNAFKHVVNSHSSYQNK